nr:hypothetical protein Iba_chr10aCG5700 [Ipomoea batatas]
MLAPIVMSKKWCRFSNTAARTILQPVHLSYYLCFQTIILFCCQPLLLFIHLFKFSFSRSAAFWSTALHNLEQSNQPLGPHLEDVPVVL